MAKRLYGHAMVEIMGDLFVLGGDSPDGGNQNSIYRLRCFAGECIWTTLTQKLKVEREEFVAIPVMDSFVNC